MDFDEQNNNEFDRSQQVPKKRSVWQIFWRIFVTLSVLANILLLFMVIGLAAVFVTGQKGIFTEEVIEAGPKTTRIAVIRVEGLIDDEQSADFHEQLKTAQKDSRVKGLVISINSPGGMVSSSDRMYNEIINYRATSEKPVVAFMHGLATSGGYYTAVGCDRIVAEPTAITGSIGVILGHFVFQGLLEEKLGIKPVVIKSGRKKDWPSPFEAVTQEQRDYLQEKLIGPAYERFVKIVDDGREQLCLEEVRILADGAIYSAEEALDEKLIDRIGYLGDAIDELKILAEIEEAQVVEYRRPFSFSQFLTSGSQSLLKIDKSTLFELGTPELLYLWK